MLLAKQHAQARTHTHATSPTKTMLVYQLERSHENAPVFPLVTRVQLSENAAGIITSPALGR